MITERTRVVRMSEYREVFQRKEIKYLLSEEQYQGIFEYLQGMAKVDGYGLSRINNIYYDTGDFRLIRNSLEKPLYKEKLRLRTYGDTKDDSNAFIEIKKKYDGIVYKRRISGEYHRMYDYLNGGNNTLEDTQIAREIEAFRKYYKDLQPAMSICYDRIAMAGTEDKDFRVTFDRNIEWNAGCRDLRKMETGRQLLRPEEYLMEIKVANAFPLQLSRKLSELQIFPASFSKYGAGYTQLMQSRMLRIPETAEDTGYGRIRNRKGEMAYV